MGNVKEEVGRSESRRGLALLLVVSISAVLSTACTTPYRSPCLRPASATFPGIADAFRDSNGNAVPEINLLLVHGMGTTDYGWVKARIKKLAPALGFQWDGLDPQPTVLKNGGLLYQVALQDSGRRLNIIGIVWSPLTAAAKATLCYDVTSASSETPQCKVAGNKDTRATLNALLKNVLMDDRLSDVTFYLGEPGGGLIREAVQDALLRSLSTNGVSLDQVSNGQQPLPRVGPVFLLSESLGSKITVDSLETLEAIPNAKNFAQVERGEINSLFLLANQIPILSLGETADAAGVTSAKSTLRTFIRKRSDKRKEEGKSDKPLRIVAFSDPNDVFSYQLSQGMFSDDSVIISNVVDSNDRTYVGLVENPITAHTGYIDQKYVVPSIARGSAVLPDPHARHCGP